MFLIFQTILCLNCNDWWEGYKKIENVSIQDVSIGRKGGIVKLIETMSQNLQFFFWQASLTYLIF